MLAQYGPIAQWQSTRLITAWLQVRVLLGPLLNERQTMPTILVHEFGDAGKLAYEEAPILEPKAGQVRVKCGRSG